MPRPSWFLLTLIALTVMGVGCFKDTSYIPAEEREAIEVAPSLEGSRASTGGQSTTVTPVLATATLVAAMPQTDRTWEANEAIEAKNPVPLPDGSRTEYTSVVREYREKEGSGRVTATLVDTRGLPALTTFLESYEERALESGYRTRIPIGNIEGWMTYTYGPNREEDGVGSFITLYRERFLIQLDGSHGVSAESIAMLASAFDLKELQ